MTSTNLPSRIAFPTPFASQGDASTFGTVASDNVNFVSGFPSVFSVPGTQGGSYVKRADLNAIGLLATNDLFYHKCGGLNTFDEAFATAIGGYPKGAVLDYLVGNNLYQVMSLIDNNTVDFTKGGPDEVSWIFCNKIQPEATETVEVFTPTDSLIPVTTTSVVDFWSYSAAEGTTVESHFPNILMHMYGEDGEIIGQFRASKSGSLIASSTLSVDKLNSPSCPYPKLTSAKPSSTSPSVNPAKFGGVGVMIYDMGTSSSITVAAPTPDTIGNWNVVISHNLCSFSAGASFVQYAPSYPSVIYGHYYKVAVVKYGTYNYNGNTGTNSSPFDARNKYTTYRWDGIKISGGSFSLSIS